ncbi:chemotaxis protein CheW [Tsuneonella sp. YG55]|uniref:Chemotaxis protein CheW n=1 Tax=Tsuneonella litorea TaxID=2976475 RepID=A0A9X2W206_9SPHN|nr:chemotaxis protein CheW [Tsuneonella litorea]MCT2559460.1 chemotaxis protein CheW [Tsuneonella litorea]
MNELVLVFTIAGRRVALRTADVYSVVEIDGVTPIPGAPGYVLGLSALRSITITVVDAAAAIGVAPPAMPERGARAAIVDHEGHRFALVVDDIDDVAELHSRPAPVPGEAGPGWQRVSEGLVETARGPALLLTLAAVLSGPDAIAA